LGEKGKKKEGGGNKLCQAEVNGKDIVVETKNLLQQKGDAPESREKGETNLDQKPRNKKGNE